MKKNEDVYAKQPWPNLDSYIDFAVKHNAFGPAAIKLWRSLNKAIPLPQVKRIKK